MGTILCYYYWCKCNYIIVNNLIRAKLKEWDTIAAWVKHLNYTRNPFLEAFSESHVCCILFTPVHLLNAFS